MPPLRLVTLDAATIDLILTDPVAFQSQRSVYFGPHTDTILESLRMTSKLFSLNLTDVPWVAFMAVRADDGAAVGSCAFKHPPRDDGSVEIGYGTYPPFENTGVATAMATELVRVARDGGAKTVIAHTLPVTTASGRVLMKAGFRFVGDAHDPEDGPVWRWEYQGQ